MLLSGGAPERKGSIQDGEAPDKAEMLQIARRDSRRRGEARDGAERLQTERSGLRATGRRSGRKRGRAPPGEGRHCHPGAASSEGYSGHSLRREGATALRAAGRTQEEMKADSRGEAGHVPPPIGVSRKGGRREEVDGGGEPAQRARSGRGAAGPESGGRPTTRGEIAAGEPRARPRGSVVIATPGEGHQR
jgi:hypothetical protein